MCKSNRSHFHKLLHIFPFYIEPQAGHICALIKILPFPLINTLPSSCNLAYGTQKHRAASHPLQSCIYSPHPKPGKHPRKNTQRGKDNEEGWLYFHYPLLDFFCRVVDVTLIYSFSSLSTKLWHISQQSVL